jgi:hypothetical protein
MKKLEPLLWLSDARGRYIPHDFAQSFVDRNKHVSGVTAEQWAILEDPEHRDYYEAWDEVLRDAVVTDNDGNKFRVHQDGDCWLIPDGMVWDENNECFAWPEDVEDEQGV